MKLNAASLKDKKAWESAGFELPAYDRAAIAENTRKAPEWLHFGAGNIFRAFPAAVQQGLLNSGKSKTGIVVAEGFDYEIIGKAYKPFDDLSVLIVLKADGSIQKKVIGSVVESLVADSAGSDWKRLVEVFTAKSLKMASFTITEKGYSLVNAQGALTADVEFDMADGGKRPRSIMGKIAALCLERYRKGAAPLALVSMDNCSHNGTKLYEAVRAIAGKWTGAGLAEKGFLAYVEDPKRLSFPWSMIDKITPRPDDSVRAQLAKDGLEDNGIIVTDRKTYTAPFVNAEEKEYLVIEDLFPNGRPPLDSGGVIFTDRGTVDRVEKMKVCTCLNPLHTTLAIFGCIFRIPTIHQAIKDPQLSKLVSKVGYDEGLPVVVDPGIIRPIDFIHDVIDIRLPNPFMPDAPARIATDTSQKLPIRFGETIKAYLSKPGSKAASLEFIPLVFAGWCRYLMGLDDEGAAFELSPDPLLEKVRKFVAGVKLGDPGPFHDALKGLLSDASIFGVDLYAVGLGERTEGYFAELVAGPGAVRRSLVKRLG